MVLVIIEAPTVAVSVEVLFWKRCAHEEDVFSATCRVPCGGGFLEGAAKRGFLEGAAKLCFSSI